MEPPYRETNSLDVMRGQNELLQRENALLKKENALQKKETALEAREPGEALTRFISVSTKPAIILALIAATVATGNGWFLVLLLFLVG